MESCFFNLYECWVAYIMPDGTWEEIIVFLDPAGAGGWYPPGASLLDKVRYRACEQAKIMVPAASDGFIEVCCLDVRMNAEENNS